MLEINKVYCEDCLETLSKIENDCIDLMLQDTPFGNTANDWDIKPVLNMMWSNWIRVCKANAAIIFFATQPFASELILSNKKMFRYDLIWEKTVPVGFLNTAKMPLRSHEIILIFYKSLPTYNPQKTRGHKQKVSKLKHKINCKKTTNYQDYNLVGYDSTERFPTSVLTFPQDKQTSSLHPTQKPLELIRYLIKTYSNENDLIFDGYMGSGTTAAGCYEENRNFIGSEISPKYCQIIKNRLAPYLQQQKLFT